MPDVAAALAEKASNDPKNNGPLKTRLRVILGTRLYPLLVAGMTTVLILLPRCYGIVRSPWTCVPRPGCHYDDVQALMLLTVVLLILLCAALASQIGAVRKKSSQL
jgi:hypothetical protein